MFPSFITNIKSAFFIVDNLCAIINEVLPSVSLSIACCTNSSVLVSTLLVASSKIRNGEFLGELIASDKNTLSYELVLPTDEMFVKVHGEIRLHYTVYTDKKIVLLTNITPDGILEEGHRAELTAYKGVMISKAHPEKDMFKINLLNMMQNK